MVTDLLCRKGDRKKRKKTPGLWDCGISTDIKKSRSMRPRYGHWPTRSKTWMPASIVYQNFPLLIDDGRQRSDRFFFKLKKKSGLGDRRRRQEKKLNSPLPFCAIVCGDLEGNNFNAAIRRPSIRGSFDGQRTPALKFLTRSAGNYTSVSRTGFSNVSGHTMVSQTGVFLSLFRRRTSVTIQLALWVKMRKKGMKNEYLLV